MSLKGNLIKKILSKRHFSEQYDVFSESYLNEIAEVIMNSGYLAENVLNYRFGTTLGFSLIFKSAMAHKVYEKFSIFKDYIEKIDANAFNVYYLNALVLQENSKVERHIDYSLGPYGKKLPFPKRVSVLYVSIPEMNGGKLRLLNPLNNVLITEIEPVENKLVFFNGNLKHEVTEIESIDSKEHRSRISLVCEQYKLNRSQLSKIPDFTVKSSIPFHNFLEIES